MLSVFPAPPPPPPVLAVKRLQRVNHLRLSVAELLQYSVELDTCWTALRFIETCAAHPLPAGASAVHVWHACVHLAMRLCESERDCAIPGTDSTGEPTTIRNEERWPLLVRRYPHYTTFGPAPCRLPSETNDAYLLRRFKAAGFSDADIIKDAHQGAALHAALVEREQKTHLLRLETHILGLFNVFGRTGEGPPRPKLIDYTGLTNDCRAILRRAEAVQAVWE